MIATILMIITLVAFVWSIIYLRKMYCEQKVERTKVCPKCLHVGLLRTFNPKSERGHGFEMTSYVCPVCGKVEYGFTTC